MGELHVSIWPWLSGLRLVHYPSQLKYEHSTASSIEVYESLPC